MIEILLKQPQYDFVSDKDKEFVVAFCEQMERMGYTCDDKIVDGICYGKYMMIFHKKGVKSKKVFARLYFRGRGVVLRLFLSNVSKHAEYIGQTPDYIKDTFVGEYAKCNYCRGVDCKFRKSYEIDGIAYDKCNGMTFEFFEPDVERLPEYLKLFKQFY